MMKNILVLKNGYLCIKCIDAMNDKPELRVNYWPIGQCTAYDAEMGGYPVNQEMLEIGTYTYIARNGSDRRQYQLLNGGQTKPIAFEIVPVEKPACKRELRWRNGEWQKLLKSGWTFHAYAQLA